MKLTKLAILLLGLLMIVGCSSSDQDTNKVKEVKYSIVRGEQRSPCSIDLLGLRSLSNDSVEVSKTDKGILVNNTYHFILGDNGIYSYSNLNYEEDGTELMDVIRVDTSRRIICAYSKFVENDSIFKIQFAKDSLILTTYTSTISDEWYRLLTEWINLDNDKYLDKLNHYSTHQFSKVKDSVIESSIFVDKDDGVKNEEITSKHVDLFSVYGFYSKYLNL